MTKEKQLKLFQDISHVAEISVNYSTKIKPSERIKITGISDSFSFFRAFYELTGNLEQKEIFSVLLLDRANKVLGWLKVSEGSNTATVVDIQYIFRASILAGAQKIILCHNHPSGNITPSRADIQMTQKVKNAGILMDIETVDHIILGPEPNQYYSFANEGEL